MSMYIYTLTYNIVFTWDLVMEVKRSIEIINYSILLTCTYTLGLWDMQLSPPESGKQKGRWKDRQTGSPGREAARQGGWQASSNAGREAGRQRQRDCQAGRYFALK